MAATSRVRQEWEATKIPVCICLMHRKKDDVEAVVKHLLTLYQARSTCQEGMESPFQADVVELRYREDLTTRLPHPMSNWLQELSAVGLALRWINSDELLDGQVAVSAITGASNTCIQANSTYSQGAQVMKIKMDGTENCKAKCMGLMHSRRVEQVTLDTWLTGMNGVVWSKWYWLLYSLFHASATHSIRSLKIYDMGFSTADLQRFRELFQAPQPLQVMYPRVQQSATLKTGSFVVLNNKSRIYFDQHRRDEDEYVMASSIETPFRVIGATGDMTSILVPCYGECWVRTSDIVSTHPDPFESDPEKQWNLTSHGITHLEVVYNEAQPPSEILDVLELIGQPVTSISIDLPGFSGAEAFDLDNLWLFCPNLTELSLKGVCLDSLDIFLQAYETGVCCLTSLEILGCDVLAQDSVASFTTALGDPSTAISRTLTHLRISLAEQYDEESGVTDDEVAQLFLSALQTNKRLSLLELQVNEEVLDETYADEFEALNGSYLNYVCNPLSLRTMCGFLSVIKHAQREVKDGPLAHMDAFVLSRIIRMAAEPGRRSVVLAERSHFFGQ
ncbi:hypothetical protein Poli38472_009308 [Pythium oligandrum]|uniref:Uncharacterized protein n=1 Tax=Pythium oligandrum TaxID=41045 RepID=A0A8K1CM06_PYTOL|nr:hypothetical protein Poli38472_009308 [Pythium oligandrum]|eukprot:TMW65141.1 hypothetical protein Poli38472_009308 [Pythium oligandrum]